MVQNLEKFMPMNFVLLRFPYSPDPVNLKNVKHSGSVQNGVSALQHAAKVSNIELFYAENIMVKLLQK